ncbi:MAG TPA: hypothetical protein VGM90_13930 [Kofleriaceae bacterium]
MRALATSVVVLAFGVSAVVAAPDAAKPKTSVEYDELATAVHPHLKSFTTKTVENGKETFKEVSTFGADGHLQKRDSYKDGALGESEELTWDANGNLTKRVMKADGETTTASWTYTLDKQGRIATALDSGGSKDTYRWDAKGGHEVTTTKSAGGKDVVVMTATLDAASHVTKRCTSTAMVTDAVAAKMTCEVTEYDSHGQKKKKGTQPAKGSPPKTYTNTYDKDGRLIKQVAGGKGGTVSAYTWNANGDIATVSDDFGDEKMVTTYSYEPR